MSSARPSFAVLGPGGVGGLVAGALAHAGESVTVVARDSTAALLAQRGLQVDSATLGRFVSHPLSVAQLEHEVDVLVVATKTVSLADALSRVHASPRLVLPLLNGVEHVAVLRRRFTSERGSQVVAGTIRVEADRPAPGIVMHSSPSVQIEIASYETAIRRSLEQLAATLSHAGLAARVLDSEAQVLWSKLVRLNALACTTCAFELPLGPIRATPPLREELVGVVRETAAVARAEGADLDADDTLGELDRAHATLTSSMARDVAAGRESELDAIAGAVLRAAARNQLPCPTVEHLVAVICRRLTAARHGAADQAG